MFHYKSVLEKQITALQSPTKKNLGAFPREIEMNPDISQVPIFKNLVIIQDHRNSKITEVTE